MKKRILSMLLTLTLILSVLPMGPTPALSAPIDMVEEAPETEIVTYPVPGGSILFDPATGTVTDYAGEPTIVDIPEKINGIDVVSINDYAFTSCHSLTEITIPASVTNICVGTFFRCEQLKSIWVNKENPNYSNDKNGVLLSKDKTELVIYPGALASNYTIPSGVTKIGDQAFAYCNGLTSITIPDGVATIGEETFHGCERLERVEISSSVTTIGECAFSSCNHLKGIWVDENNSNYCSDENGVLFSKDKTELVVCPGALASNYTIPSGVTKIGDWAFAYCDGLTSISIPDSVTTIGDWAFGSCLNLTTATMSDSVTTLGQGIFSCCYSLTNVTISDSITSLSPETFYSCLSLTNITIPNGVTSIGDYTFVWCERLTTVTIPASVTTISNLAFDVCYNLSTICYGSTPEQWAQVDKDPHEFMGCTIHFCPSTNFKDTPIYDNWAHDGIDYCVENELMNGVGNNLFNPDGTVSRAQLVTILYRMAGSPATEFKNTFTDVVEGLWYSDAIEWAAANGVVNGVGNGKFAPDRSITREQIATILYRYHGSPAVSGSLGSFPDASTVSDFATNGMLWATQKGLINGVSSGGVTSLAPQANATRAQIATIIMRYCEAA